MATTGTVPATAGRKLHIERFLRAALLETDCPVEEPLGVGTGITTLATSPFHYRVRAATHSSLLDTGEASFHVVTAVGGAIELMADGGRVELAPLDSVLLPACFGEYRIRPEPGARALIADVEPERPSPSRE